LPKSLARAEAVEFGISYTLVKQMKTDLLIIRPHVNVKQV